MIILIDNHMQITDLFIYFTNSLEIYSFKYELMIPLFLTQLACSLIKI